MKELSEDQQKLVEEFADKGLEVAWNSAPDDLKRYKCTDCRSVVWSTPCPKCGNPTPDKMCPADHCLCSHDVISGIKYCPVCGAPVCPECGCHDVLALSRITGYIQPISGWNAGKQQELKDRVRYEY